MSQAQGLLTHLIELRDRLLRAIVAWLIVFAALIAWAPEIYAIVAAPLLAKLPAGGQMIATDVTTPFFVPLKLTMMVAFLLALPYVLYQIWGFVAPGLYAHEKRLAAPLLVASVTLFFLGIAFVYFAVLPAVFGFITSVAPEGVAVMTDIDKYLSFLIGMALAFGFAFQVPVAVILAVTLRWVAVEKLREARPYIIVGAFVVGAIFTPPDVISQLMLAIPIWLLFEAGLFLADKFYRPRMEEAQ